MATIPTPSNNEEGSSIHPIPSSVIIVNESTPLISQEQHLAGGILHVDTAFHLNSCLTLSQNEEQRETELIGLLLILISSILFTGVSVYVKVLSPTFPFFEIVFARSAIQLPLGLIGCFIVKVNPLGKKGIRKWIFFRALASSIALALFFYSLTKLTLVEATVIFFMGPVFKVIIGAILLNESFNIMDAFYTIFCLVGLILVSKPRYLFRQGAANDQGYAIFCGLAASFMSAMAYITVRKVGQGTHVMVHVVYFGCVASILSVFAFLFHYQTVVIPKVNWNELGLLLTMGCIAFIGQYFLNRGLKMAPTGPVTLIRTTDVVFAFLFGIVIFKEIPGFYTMVGSILIVTMTTIMSIHRWHRQQLLNATIRRKKSKDKLARHQQRQQKQQQQQQQQTTA